MLTIDNDRFEFEDVFLVLAKKKGFLTTLQLPQRFSVIVERDSINSSRMK